MVNRFYGDNMNAKKISRKKAIVATSVIMVLISILIVAANVTVAEDSEDPIFEGEVTVTLNATDDWSGVNYTMYYISYTDPLGGQDDGDSWIEYSEPFVVSEMGRYNISYYSVDMASNIEETKSTSFIIIGDVTPPVTVCTLDGILH